MNKYRDSKNRRSIAVLFGGRSAEHEISVITALQAIHAIDTLRYAVVPIYLHPNGSWYTGSALLDKKFYRGMPDNLSQVQRVTLLPDPSIAGLLPISSKGRIALDEVIPIDAYFLAFHGQYGEDGAIQGLLEMAEAAYTGCGVLPSAVAMHKYHCKMFLHAHGIPTLPSTVVQRQSVQRNCEAAVRQIFATPGLEQFPLFVKPCRLGSSIGISAVHDLPGLHGGLAKAFQYDDEVLVEPCVKRLLEINVAVIENDPVPIASVVEIPIASGESLTYEDKYLRGGNKSSGASAGMASLTRIIDPKDLDTAFKKRVQEYAVKAYTLLGCAGVGRFDFIYDLATERLYFNELNPIPGSLAFYLWAKHNPPLLYTEVIDRLITGAIQRKAARLTLKRDIGFKAL